MTRSKKIFIACIFAFFAFLVFIVVDISRKTTFPGSRKRQNAANEVQKALPSDTLKSNPSAKSATHQP